MIFLFVILLVIILFLTYPLMTKMKLAGKMMVLTIEKDRSLNLNMVKIKDNLLSVKNKEGTEIYHIDSSKVITSEYPMTGLKIMRHKVPCLVFARDNPEPLDPKTVSLSPKSITAKEIGTAMDEHIIDEIVRATEERTGSKFSSMLIPLATLGGIAIVLGMLWMLRVQLEDLTAQMAELIVLFGGE